jgi:hypothetical protein
MQIGIKNAVELAHVDPNKVVCVFTDASESYWGAQIPSDQRHLNVNEQAHDPLMFLSGTFSWAASRWAIVEKEAFALIECVKRADYLLHRSGGFLLFTDHRNLRYIFNPESVMATVRKYTADKLQRWSLLLMGYQYQINHIPGGDNAWADLLSRWGSGMCRICAIHLENVVTSPQLDDKFQWPSMTEIKSMQERSKLVGPCNSSGIIVNSQGQIVIP